MSERMTPKYSLGDVVWRAIFASQETWITCPDCGGTGRLRVTFHDETQVSIGCQNCAIGYDRPNGLVKVYDRTGKTEAVIIAGVSVGHDGFEYNWHLKEADLFTDKAEAEAAAAAMAVQSDADERAKIATKEKDTRTWAWNASYHRREIKEAKRRLEYHESKLAVAALKSKEPLK